MVGLVVYLYVSSFLLAKAQRYYYVILERSLQLPDTVYSQ
jgi:hypothetical protein